MYTNDRNAYRRAFFQAWEKYQKKLPLELIETKLVEVILLHPEYHPLLSAASSQEQSFLPEENPFLHLSLHLSIEEQLRLDRPQGAAAIYTQLLAKNNDHHETLHKMMEQLAKVMWHAQESGKVPDETDYLEKLRGIL